MTTTSALQVNIDKTQQQIDALTKDRENRRQKAAELESERRKWLIAARVDNEPKAQKEIEKCGDRIAALQRDDDLDYATIAELRERLKAQKANLDAQHWRDRCVEVRALVEPHVDGKLESRLMEVAAELRDILLKLQARDAEIGPALRGLGGRFSELAMELPYKERNRKNTVAAFLRDVFPQPAGGWCGNPPAEAAELFWKCIELLRGECDKKNVAA